MVFGTSPLMPGGAFEIPGFDPEWQTIAKHENQILDVPVVGEVTVKAGSILRVYRQHDGRGYNFNTDVVIDFENCSQDIKELEAPVASGETLYFEFTVMVTGQPDANVGVCVRTPPNPTGGFHVVSRDTVASASQASHGNVFGADSFNNPAGSCRAGNDGDVESHNIIRIRGVLGNGPIPGLLKLQLGPALEGVSMFWGGGFGLGVTFTHTWSDVIDPDEFILIVMEGNYPNPLEFQGGPYTGTQMNDFSAAEVPFFHADGPDWVHHVTYGQLLASGDTRYVHFISGRADPDGTSIPSRATFQAFAGSTGAGAGGNVYYGPSKLEKGAGHALGPVIRDDFVASSSNPVSIPFDNLDDPENICVLFPLSSGSDNTFEINPGLRAVSAGGNFRYGNRPTSSFPGPFIVTYETALQVDHGHFICEIEHTKS